MFERRKEISFCIYLNKIKYIIKIKIIIDFSIGSIRIILYGQSTEIIDLIET